MTAEPVEPGAGRPGPLGAPATSLIALSWVVLFVLMAIARGGPIPPTTLLFGGFIPSPVSHAFGDVTAWALYGGQFWRALTATFIHFNLLHLALNLIAFSQLGRVVESWYGSWQFLAIYVVLGAGANLIANLARPWISGPSALILHSGGGSTVVLGLIGLVAVVGWRNPSEFPKRAPLWMAAILLANAVLGVVVPNIDNLGHAAGAAVGGLVGLLDRRLLRRVRSRRAIVAGLLGATALVGSAAAQLDQRDAERDATERVLRWEAVVQHLSWINRFYVELAARRRDDLTVAGRTAEGTRAYHERAARGGPALMLVPRPPNPMGHPVLVIPEDPAVLDSLHLGLRAAIARLEADPAGLDRGPTAESYRTVRMLAARALFKPPTNEELALFRQQLAELSRPAFESWLAARVELNRLQRPEPRFASRALSRLVRRATPPPAGAGAAPTFPSAPPRNQPSSESGPGTP